MAQLDKYMFRSRLFYLDTGEPAQQYSYVGWRDQYYRPEDFSGRPLVRRLFASTSRTEHMVPYRMTVVPIWPDLPER